MLIDHIFVFCSSKHCADELVDFGVSEGSGRSHQGIGTANRRFFFENFYLEILWVENQLEAKSTKDVSIWQRYNYEKSGYSPFGLCFENSNKTDCLFKESLAWRPSFLPIGSQVDLIINPQLPWIFRFPRNRNLNLDNEPNQHTVGLKKLTKATFGAKSIYSEPAIELINKNSIAKIHEQSQHSLSLEFDNGKQNKSETFERINLTIKY